MALKPCRECKKKVSTEAATCPHCGVPEPTLDKSKNILEEVWMHAEQDYEVCEATLKYIGAQVDKDSEYRMWSIAIYFYRGLFEASCMKHKLDKNDYKKAIIYCFRRGYDIKIYSHLNDQQKDQFSKQTYADTEVGLRYDDKTGKMCKKIIESGRNSFQSKEKSSMGEITKLWKDPNINFTESSAKREVGNFFKKLF